MNTQPEYSQSPPPNYLIWGILTTIFCCLPFGVVSIVYAAQVNSRWSSGDREGAINASKNAKIWAWVAIGFGTVGYILGIIFGVAGSLAEWGMETFNV